MSDLTQQIEPPKQRGKMREYSTYFNFQIDSLTIKCLINNYLKLEKTNLGLWK